MPMRKIRRSDGRYFEVDSRDQLADRVREQLIENPPSMPPSVTPKDLGDITKDSKAFLDDETEHPLAGIKLLLIGAGAVGSWVIKAMSPYGGTYYCVDPDIVEPRNRQWERSIYGPDDDGKKKVDALRDNITARWPRAEVIPIPYRLRDLGEAGILALSANCALTLAAFDDGDDLLLLNRLAHSRTTCLYPAAHRQAASGHVIITTPYTPCLRCCLAVSSSGQITTLHGEPGVGINFKTVSDTCARIALSILVGKRLPALRESYDRRANILYISNRISDPVVGGVGIAPWWSGWNPDCPVCGNTVERR